MRNPGTGNAGSNALGEKKSLWQELVARVFGYDYFISYSWSDGRVYATRLAESLHNSGFECFLDSSEYRAGDDWRRVGQWTLRQTSSLILVGSPNAVSSEPVFYELQTFQRFNNRIVPIDFDGTLDPHENNTRIVGILTEDIIRLREPAARLVTGPSDSTIRRLQDDFKGIKQTQRRTRLLAAATLVFALTAAVTIWMFLRAESARREERRQNMINVAQRLNAEALNEAGRLDHERAALLARQAYLLNRTYHGDSIARADYALRSVLTSHSFNTLLLPNRKAALKSKPIPIRSIAYSPATDLVAIAGDEEVGLVRLHDSEATWKPLRHPPLRFPALALSTNGKELAVVGAKQAALLYDITLSDPEPKLLDVDTGTTTSLAFSHDNRLLVVGTDTGTILGWNLPDGTPVHHLIGKIPGKRINSMVLSPDSKTLATADVAGGILVSDLQSGRHRVIKRKRNSAIRSLDYSPDGRWLAAASTSPSCVLIWPMDRPDATPLTHKLSSPLSVAFTSDGRTLVAGSGLGQLYVWATDQLDAPPVSLRPHRDQIRALAAVPMDRRFITGSLDGTVRIWEPGSATEASFRWTPGSLVKPAGPEIHHDGWIAYSMLSQAGVSRGSDGMLLLHRKSGGNEQNISLAAAGTSAAFSSTGRFLAVAIPSQSDSETRGTPDNSVTIWDLERSSIAIKIHWGDSTVRVSTGDLRAESTDSGRVELHQHREPAGKPAVLEVPDSPSAPSLSFSADGAYLLTMSRPSEKYNVDRMLRLHVSSTAALAAQVCRRVRRNLTQEEWRSFVGSSLAYEKTCPALPAGP
jgi:WD40 repeat protein